MAERRRGPRVLAEGTPWQVEALIRPGLPVLIVNISSFGALLESRGRLLPGRMAELQLTTLDGETRLVTRGQVRRCQVVGLTPLRYRGSIAFDGDLRW